MTMQFEHEKKKNQSDSYESSNSWVNKRNKRIGLYSVCVRYEQFNVGLSAVSVIIIIIM